MTADPFVVSRLRTLPLFAQLTPPQLALVASIAQRHALPAGTLALGQGQPSMGALLLVSGRGVFTRHRADGAEEQVAVMEAGQYVNEASLFSARTEPVSLRITQDAVVIFIPRDAFTSLMHSTPELAANLRVVQPAPPVTAAPPRMPPPAPAVSPAAGGTPAPRPPRIPIGGASAAAAPPAAPDPVRATASAAAVPGGAVQDAPRVAGARLFRGQRPDEHVLYVFRRHWWAFGRHLWMPGALVSASVIGAVLLAMSAGAIAFGLLVLGVIAAALLTLYLYVEWRNDSIVLTDERIVQISRSILGFQSALSEIPLDRVLEVSTSVPPGDPFAQAFRYSTLFIRTAGEAANLQLGMIADANNIQSFIFAQRDAFRQRVLRQQGGTVQADVQAALGVTPTTPIAAQGAPVAAVPSSPPLDTIDDVGLPFIRTRFILPDGDIAYRHHSTVWLRMVFFPTLVLIAGLVLMAVSAFVPTSPLPGVIGISAGMLLFLVGLVLFYLADWDWRNDLLILGSDAVTIVRKRPLWLQNQVERMRMSQIDNVTSEVEGLLNNLLNRGEVRIAMIGAAQSDIKRFSNVYDPEAIQSEVSRRLSVLRAQKQAQELEAQRQVMLEYLAAYHRQTQGGAPG
jgi:hypothetical protein